MTIILDNANALLSKAQKELQYARAALELLQKCQHPMMILPTPHSSWLTDREKLSAPDVCILAISRINNILGDRV